MRERRDHYNWTTQDVGDNAGWHYRGIAIVLHWTIAILIIGLLVLGWYMLRVEHTAAGPTLIGLHKSLGLAVAGLIVLRILWRVGHPPASLPDSVPVWQVKLAKLSHWLLYASMIVMPLAGYLGASYGKHPTFFFGLPTPVWTSPDRSLSHLFFAIHYVTAWVLVVLISLHALAGFKHLLIDKDGVFQRMWFGRA
jgi:cytochrome b561